jgi:hypothetical protein
MTELDPRVSRELNFSSLIHFIWMEFSEFVSTDIESPSVNLLKFELGILIEQTFRNRIITDKFGLRIAEMSRFKLRLWWRADLVSSIVHINLSGEKTKKF